MIVIRTPQLKKGLWVGPLIKSAIRLDWELVDLPVCAIFYDKCCSGSMLMLSYQVRSLCLKREGTVELHNRVGTLLYITIHHMYLEDGI